MNDIDRSVDSMDFAMRRRFHWIEISADDVMRDALVEMWNGKNGKFKYSDDQDSGDDFIKCIEAMNKVLVEQGGEHGLDESYKIGPSYFEKYNGINAPMIFENYIRPQVREYLRGTNRDAVEELIDNMQKALIPESENSAKNDEPVTPAEEE